MRHPGQRVFVALRELSIIGICAFACLAISQHIENMTLNNLQRAQTLRNEYDSRLHQFQKNLQDQEKRHSALAGKGNAQLESLNQQFKRAPLVLRFYPNSESESPDALRPWRQDWNISFNPLHENELMAQVNWFEQHPRLRLRTCRIERSPPSTLGLSAECRITERRVQP